MYNADQRDFENQAWVLVENFLITTICMFFNATILTNVVKEKHYVYGSCSCCHRMYQSATREDLWGALTEQAQIDSLWHSDMSVKTIMDTWTLQTGFPLVTVTRDYNKKTVHISQVERQNICYLIL